MNPLPDVTESLPTRRAEFDIATSSGKMAKLSLPRTQFKIGEEIVAAIKFDIDEAATRCVQYSASLVCR